MTIQVLSMSHDQIVLHAKLGKTYAKTIAPGTNWPIIFSIDM